jgi:predicted permease
MNKPSPNPTPQSQRPPERRVSAQRPPRWADRLLSWLAPPELLEELQGDLHEQFAQRALQVGPRRAGWWYGLEALKIIRPYYLRRRVASLTNRQKDFLPKRRVTARPSFTLEAQSPSILTPDMLQNYLKIAFRNLVHNKVYAGINISGLAIGIACCLAIGLYVWYEYSFDRFHTNAKHIYRVVEKQNQAGTLYDIASSPGILAPALKADFAEIQQTCRIDRAWGIVTHESTSVELDNMLRVDPSFFSMFDFPLLRGNAQKALLGPNEIIISEAMAERFFGSNWRQSTQLLGQLFKWNNRTLTLVGVAKNAPHNSHIQFNVLLPFRQIELDPDQYKWNNDSHYNYILLNPNADIAALNQKLFHYLARYRPVDKPTLSLQPLLDIYLNPDFDFHTDWSTKGSRLYIQVFIAVGLIVLLIALFNFMNLTTARAMKRAREVGVRKAIGALRVQLIGQFLGESLLMTFLAIILALVLLQVSLPLLNDVAAKSLTIPFREPWFGVLIIGFVLLISGLAGIYPAFYLSRFQPVKVLKGAFDVRSGQLFRRTLVVSQFVMSVMLIIGAMGIYRQLTFMQDRNLGFDKSQLLHVWIRNELNDKKWLLKSELQQQKSIAQVTISTSNLVDLGSSTYDLSWEGQAKGEGFVVTHNNVDPDFLATTGIKLLAGRNFDPSITTDTSSAYMINETAAKQMHWTPEQALGKTLTFWGKKGKIIGVVKDFHFRPLTASIEPFLFRYWPNDPYTYSTLLIKTQPDQTREAIAAVEALYKKYRSLMPPYYAFVDESLANQYRTEQRTGQIVLYFSILAILVSCLGLFGLVTFTAEQRTKEIGIRKVMGATVTNIVTLLSKDFLKLVFVAILIASPIAWYAMNQWLSNFAYKIDMEWWMFVLSGVLAIGIAVVTVSFQSIKAALVNPVKSLRNE